MLPRKRVVVWLVSETMAADRQKAYREKGNKEIEIIDNLKQARPVLHFCIPVTTLQFQQNRRQQKLTGGCRPASTGIAQSERALLIGKHQLPY